MYRNKRDYQASLTRGGPAAVAARQKKKQTRSRRQKVNTKIIVKIYLYEIYMYPRVTLSILLNNKRIVRAANQLVYSGVEGCPRLHKYCFEVKTVTKVLG